MRITRTAFQESHPIPKRYTKDGADVSPALRWQDAPEATKSFVLLCADPDAPRGTWVHWVLYDVPAAENELPEQVPTARELPRREARHERFRQDGIQRSPVIPVTERPCRFNPT